MFNIRKNAEDKRIRDKKERMREGALVPVLSHSSFLPLPLLSSLLVFVSLLV